MTAVPSQRMRTIRPELPAGRRRDRFTSALYACVRFVAQRGILKPIVWMFTRVSVLGHDRLTGVRGPFIIVANHSSHLDAPLLLGALPRPLVRYLAVGAAADYFFTVWWRKWLIGLFFNGFAIDRTPARTRGGMSKRLLGVGVPLLIFPEGTRSRTGEMGTFNPGAAALSIVCDVPCVPAAIEGAHRAMPRGTSWPVWGRPPVSVVFGEPMSPRSGERADEYNERIAQEVRRLQRSECAVAVPDAREESA